MESAGEKKKGHKRNQRPRGHGHLADRRLRRPPPKPERCTEVITAEAPLPAARSRALSAGPMNARRVELMQAVQAACAWLIRVP